MRCHRIRRFEVEFSTSLNRALRALGIRKPFEGGDLSRVRARGRSMLAAHQCRQRRGFAKRGGVVEARPDASGRVPASPTATRLLPRPRARSRRRISLLHALLRRPAAPPACTPPAQIATESSGAVVADLQVSDVIHKVYAKVRAWAARRWVAPGPGLSACRALKASNLALCKARRAQGPRCPGLPPSPRVCLQHSR